MPDDIFEQLRKSIKDDSDQQPELQQTHAHANADTELKALLDRVQFFRSNIIPAMLDALGTALTMQRERICSAQMEDVVSIRFPLESAFKTKYGFEIPLLKGKSEHGKTFYGVLTLAVPQKPKRHYLLVFHALPLESQIAVDIVVYDELGRRLHDLPAQEAAVDSHSMFKEGEFLLAIHALVKTATEACIKDML